MLMLVLRNEAAGSYLEVSWWMNLLHASCFFLIISESKLSYPALRVSLCTAK